MLALLFRLRYNESYLIETERKMNEDLIGFAIAVFVVVFITWKVPNEF